MLLPILGLFGFVVYRAIYPKVEKAPLGVRRLAAALEKPRVVPAVTESGGEPPHSEKSAGSIVLIMDDFGFDGQPIERAMTLDPDINFAILPNGTRAADFADRLNDHGFEILVHLPMEPLGSASPGHNAILTSMPDEEIARLVRENVRAVPHARGMNNHMGSRATADRRVMSTVLNALPRGMYFVDSRTIEKSVAEKVARELNVRTAARHVFLDDVRTPAAVRQQLETLVALARERGVAVGIGHPHQVTLDVLAAEVPRLRERGFRFLRASAIVD
ncbi:MAG TPA: divergent polysaccharide deacetylase family protein [Thermoanaerobaculia bacterium]|nr:divergent polysaccharide deacetylase family protein [Thermoanaerobaculia bacterium]